MFANKLFLLLNSFVILSCSQKNVNTEEHFNDKLKYDSLRTKIFSVIDSVSLTFPKEYPVYLYTVSHQKKNNIDYIKISTSDMYNKDSLSESYLNKGKIVVFYSKDFFNKKINKPFLPNKNFECSIDKISMYHKKYLVYKIKENKLVGIKNRDVIKNELFNYGDCEVPEPKPSRR